MLALLLATLATPSAAETPLTVQPINIEADRFTVYLADEKAIWQGDVVASQGNYTFRTSVLTLHLEQFADEASSAAADNGPDANNARPPFSLTARSVKYDLDQGTVSGQGNSELRRGEEVLRADRITYQVADQVAYGVPEAHGRVSVKFYGNPKRPVIPGSLGIASRGAE
ncbi:MAG: LptA/OstA family protein [Pseudomonadota bacterium]